MLQKDELRNIAPFFVGVEVSNISLNYSYHHLNETHHGWDVIVKLGMYLVTVNKHPIINNSDIIFKPPCKLKAFILLVRPRNNEGGGSEISVDKHCFYPETDISSKRVICCFMKLKLNYLPPPNYSNVKPKVLKLRT